MELRPGLGVCCSNCGHNRDTGLNCFREDRAKTATFRFGFAEFIEHQKLDIMSGRSIEQRCHIDKPTRIKTAAECLRPEVLRNLKSGPRRKVNDTHL